MGNSLRHLSIWTKEAYETAQGEKLEKKGIVNHDGGLKQLLRINRAITQVSKTRQAHLNKAWIDRSRANTSHMRTGVPGTVSGSPRS